MKPTEYLDKAKIALKVQSDYALAKALDLPTQRISEYYKGKTWPDIYACAKIALALKLDPFEVLADIEEQKEKNEVRRAFWRGFTQRSGKVAAVLLLALCLSIFFTIAPGAGVGVAASAAVIWWMRQLRIMGAYDMPS